ncbi:DUF951 domain-containing protein [Sporolactobacillus shoreicorticis]|uniref:DUF951 domain-containing protein n=1 Tax=Sporolactobacillus shoreicorticis TaxID=1923877 RepID=A0ABW5S8Q2_9BACL|nr:DUF951 domain-containing protein [Sporolactobacillus shoreicorticis]MCO7126089.1 DUF951 domain-containing protein [Sporolactobacillus shoreicorticis]
MPNPRISFDLNDVVAMKKSHPCGENQWKIIRMGADIRIKCLGCGHSVMMPRSEFQRKVKKILEHGSKAENNEM